VATYFGLSRVQCVFFSLLLQRERAGTPDLKALLQEELARLRRAEDQLARRIPVEKRLPLADQALFYSNWYYSAIRNLVSIPGCSNIRALSERIGVSAPRVSEAVRFLLETGLVREENGKLVPGPKSTHLEPSSPIVSRHHSNWRVRAMDRHPDLRLDKELAYTSPMSLSKEDALVVREELMKAVERICSLVDPSPSQTAYCLNIDWFEI
jgi:hypothetical protein